MQTSPSGRTLVRQISQSQPGKAREREPCSRAVPLGSLTLLLSTREPFPLKSPASSARVSWDSSFPSVRQDPTTGPWKRSSFLQQFVILLCRAEQSRLVPSLTKAGLLECHHPRVSKGKAPVSGVLTEVFSQPERCQEHQRVSVGNQESTLKADRVPGRKRTRTGFLDTTEAIWGLSHLMI